jgi:hypothetical protein
LAEYKSRFPELMFYVGESARKFHAGRYVTEDAKEIEVLDGIVDVVRVDEPNQPETKPEDKAPAKRKPSGK